MSDKHAGPSKYRPKNQATAPPAPKKGAIHTGAHASGKFIGHPHEQSDKGSPLGKGYGKIKSTGKPRHTRF